MKTSTVIAQTSKGHRIFLEGLGRTGQRYNVRYHNATIVVHFVPDGKRKVVARGVIDLEGKKVTAWKQNATSAIIAYNDDSIVITRG